MSWRVAEDLAHGSFLLGRLVGLFEVERTEKQLALGIDQVVLDSFYFSCSRGSLHEACWIRLPSHSLYWGGNGRSTPDFEGLDRCFPSNRNTAFLVLGEFILKLSPRAALAPG